MNHSYWRGDFKGTRLKSSGLWCSAHTDFKCEVWLWGSHFCGVDSLSPFCWRQRGSEAAQMKGSTRLVATSSRQGSTASWHRPPPAAQLGTQAQGPCWCPRPSSAPRTGSQILTLWIWEELLLCIFQVPPTPVALDWSSFIGQRHRKERGHLLRISISLRSLENYQIIYETATTSPKCII